MSDLLNSASLVMIPSGYKEDTVFSQIPTDGSGDLSFTRASNGTRINSAGLVEVCPWNLLEQSEAFTNTAIWNVLNGASVSANTATAPNGTTTADTITFATNPSSNVYCYPTAPIGKINVSVYAKTASGTKEFALRVDLPGGTTSPNFTATTEWQRFDFEVTTTVANLVFYIINDSSGTAGSIFIWGAQLNIGSTAKPYFPTTDRLNVPRLTYQNGGGGCPSLLLEKQSTNLVSYSEQFDNAYWTKQGLTVTANSIVSPDGTQNADLLTLNTSLEEHNAYAPAAGLTITSNAPFTFSCYVKKGTGRYFCVATYFTGVGFGPYATFDLNTATLVASGAPFGTYSSSKIENMGNDWYRCSVTGFGPYTSLIFAPDIRSASSLIPGVPFTGAGETMYVYGAQLEASSYPTSYIPTTSSSATRVADACFKTGISSLFGTNQGTFFLDFVYIGQRESSSSFPYIFDILNASLDRIIMYGSATNTGYDTYDLWDSTNFVLGNINLYYNTRYKIAVKYSSSGIVCYLNGTLAVNSTASFNKQMSGFYLARRYSDTEINSLKVNQNLLFPTAITNAELASLTTI